MGDIIELKPAALVEDHAFVTDLARFREGLVDEKAIRKKYRVGNDVWQSLGENDELIRKVEEESVRRVRDGSVKREKSQQLITKAPGILDSIASDVSASPRHRVDAIKALDGMASNGPEGGPPASDRFVITIVMNDEVLKFDKSIKPDSGDVDPHHPDDMPMIAAKKSTDGGDGEPV